MEKLKILRNEQEMMKDKRNNSELTHIFLICKILGTLPEKYFSFKSSWMLMPRNDNLTDQFCTYEKILTNKIVESMAQKAFIINTSKKSTDQSKQMKKIVCNYCKKSNDIIKKCWKWITGGRSLKY